MNIYLAGPDVFFPNPVELGEEKKKICQKYGFVGHFPLDNVIENFKHDQETAYRISLANEELIRKCNIVVANLTPFRGPSADVGTVYELGFARGLGKKVHGYVHYEKSPYKHRVYYSKTENQYGLDNADDIIVDSDGYTVENFDLYDNLMIEGGIHANNGYFLTKYGSNLEVFEELIQIMAQVPETMVDLQDCKYLTKNSIAQQVAIRRKLLDQMVGNFYPPIIQNEIEQLLAM